MTAEIPDALITRLENDGAIAKAKLALLIRLSQAESLVDRGGCSTALEQLAWRGIEDLSRDVLRYLEEIERETGVTDSGFAMLQE